MSGGDRNSKAWSLFGPRRYSVRAFSNRPFILTVRNDGEAGALGVLPGRAKAILIELPRAFVFVAR